MSVMRFHICVNGIYAWGDGFRPGMGKIWHNYFNTLNPIFWRVVKDDTSTFLVSVYAGAMVHPLDGFTVYCADVHKNAPMFEELKNIFSDLADKCGASYTFSVDVIGDMQEVPDF